MAERRVIASTRAAQGSDVHDVVRLLGPLASEELVAGFLRRGKCVEVATLLGEVVGLAVLEWLHPLQRAGSEAWLTALVTDASARHRGVARALLGSIGRRVRQGRRRLSAHRLPAGRRRAAVFSRRHRVRAAMAGVRKAHGVMLPRKCGRSTRRSLF